MVGDLHHITENKRFCYASPKLPSVTFFIHKMLSEISPTISIGGGKKKPNLVILPMCYN